VKSAILAVHVHRLTVSGRGIDQNYWQSASVAIQTTQGDSVSENLQLSNSTI
jgi:hypothetical protein